LVISPAITLQDSAAVVRKMRELFVRPNRISREIFRDAAVQTNDEIVAAALVAGLLRLPSHR
jgi:hypothetical protein